MALGPDSGLSTARVPASPGNRAFPSSHRGELVVCRHVTELSPDGMIRSPCRRSRRSCGPHERHLPASVTGAYATRWPFSKVSSVPATSAGATASTGQVFRYCNTMLAEPPVRSWPIALDLGNGPGGIPNANS